MHIIIRSLQSIVTTIQDLSITVIWREGDVRRRMVRGCPVVVREIVLYFRKAVLEAPVLQFWHFDFNVAEIGLDVKLAGVDALRRARRSQPYDFSVPRDRVDPRRAEYSQGCALVQVTSESQFVSNNTRIAYEIGPAYENGVVWADLPVVGEVSLWRGGDNGSVERVSGSCIGVYDKQIARVGDSDEAFGVRLYSDNDQAILARELDVRRFIEWARIHLLGFQGEFVILVRIPKNKEDVSWSNTTSKKDGCRWIEQGTGLSETIVTDDDLGLPTR